MLKKIRGFKGLNGVYKDQYKLYRTKTNEIVTTINSSSIYPAFDMQNMQKFVITNKEVVFSSKPDNVVVERKDNNILYELLLRMSNPKNRRVENIDLGQLVLDKPKYSENDFLNFMYVLRCDLSDLLRTGDINRFQSRYYQLTSLGELVDFFKVEQDYQGELTQLKELAAVSEYPLLHANYAFELLANEELGKVNEEVVNELKYYLSIKKGLR